MNALSDLDDTQCRALALIYSDGFTQAQVALKLGIPESAVRRCVALGMRRLTARLTTAGATRRPRSHQD